MPVTRHGRQQRKSGGVATKPEAQRIAANIAKVPVPLKVLNPQRMTHLVYFETRCHEPHSRPPHRLANRLGIGGIVLVALDVGLHVFRRHQPHLGQAS
jgi:hypothetical protein